MAGAAEGADLAVVEQMLYTNMLFVSMEIDVNLHILKKVIGPMFRFCRSVYFCNRNECVLDIVPKHADTLDQIKSFAGVNLYRTRQFKVRISAAEELFEPGFFTDYAFALTTGKVPESLTPKFLIVNKEWLEQRVRRDSDSSVSTYPLLTSEDKGEGESDITSINLNVTQDDAASSRNESLSDQQVASEASDVEANDPDTVVEPGNDSDESSSTSSEEEQEDTTLKRTENPITSEEHEQPIQDVIPNVCTPASPWRLTSPMNTAHTPNRRLHPPTPTDPFQKPDELLPPVPDRPETPARIPNPVVTQTPKQKIPTTPARTTPLHKPRYTPDHPKPPKPSKLKPIPTSDTKKPKEPFTLKIVQESLREISNSGYTPPIMDKPINRKQNSTEQSKPPRLNKPVTIHSPPRRSYPTSYPIPDYYHTGNLEQKIPPAEPSPKESEEINVQVVSQAIDELKQEQLKSLIDTLIIQYEQRQELEAMPPPNSSNHAQVFHLGGKVGVDGGCEEPGLETELEAQHQLSPNPKPNPTSTPHNHNQPTLQLAETSVNVGNTSVSYPELQTSFQAMTEGLLKAVMKEGVLRHDTPKLHEFTGKPEDGKASWRRWELQVKGLQGTYSDKAIKEAMNKALQGDAAIVADSLADDCTWIELLNALRAKFTEVSSLDVMMGSLYSIKQGTLTVSQYAIKLEKVLGSVRVSHPTALSGKEYQHHLRSRFFHGLSDKLRNSLRHKYETECDYDQLLQYARMIESEKNDNTSEVSSSSTTKTTKAKASSVQSEKQGVDMQKLEQAYRCCQGELMRMNKNVQQLQQMKASLEATSFQTSTNATPKASTDGGGGSNGNSPNSNTQPSPNNSGKSNFKGKGRGKGNKRSSYDPPGKPPGWSKLCFWCRNFTTFEQANHPLRECPHYLEVRKNWWARHQATTDSNSSSTDTHTTEGNQ